MATKTFSGTLSQAMDSLAAEGNKIIFVPQQTVGDVLTGASSIMTVESDGSYSVDLSYNTYSIYHYSDVTKRKIKIGDNIVVATDTTADTLSDLITSATGELTSDEVLAIQGYLDDADGYATDAADSYTATSALFDDFDANVLDVVGEIHTDTPALSIPFNESIKLDYGVGVEYVTDLPVYKLAFLRDNESIYINKSGTVSTAAEDEPAIGDDGIWLHNAYTNYVKVSNALYLLSNGGVITTESTDDYLFNSSSTLVTESTDDSEHYVNIRSTTYDVGYINFSMFVKAAAGVGDRNFSMRFYGGAIGTNVFSVDSDGVITTSDVQSSVQSVGDGWYRCSAYQEVTDDSTPIGTRFTILDSSNDNTYTGDGTSGFYIDGAQVTEGITCLPLLETSGDELSASPTACVGLINGNFPAAGLSFTISFDADFGDDDIGTYNVFSCDSDVSGGAILFRKSGGEIQWYHDDADGSNGLISYTGDYDTGRHKYTLTFDGSKFSMYADGDLLGTRIPDDFCWFDNDGQLVLTASYRNQLKNFNLYHYAADAAEVASWGGAK